MTVFYSFPEPQPMQGDFVRPDGISVSVLGSFYEPEPDPLPEDYEPVFKEFLVNTSAPVDEWEQHRLVTEPNHPMRIFG